METSRHQMWLYRIALTMLPGIGDVRARKLVAYCGSVEAVFDQKRNHLRKIPGIGAVLAEAVASADLMKQAEAEIQFMVKNGIRPIFFLDPDYPKRFESCEDSPILIYTKGKLELNALRVLSVVGTRKATVHGRAFTEQFIAELAPHNVLIVSGLAYGIDIEAHKAAVKYGLPTVACLAHGLDRIYPSLHKKTALEMLDNGGWVTDFPSGTKPSRDNFPSRNRVIAGLSDATIVVEAAESGGALITADIAASYNRDVFAVPGRYNDAASAGCNAFIYQNKAALVTTSAQLVAAMGWDEPNGVGKQARLFVEVTAEQQPLQQLLNDGAMRIDQISAKLAMPTSKVSAMLMEMELAGAVTALPGKVYRLA